ncbi:MAG: DUF5989 family protein [Gemmatimonadota bacterium]
MAKASLMGQIWGYVKSEKKFWLLPIVVMLLVVGTLLVLAQGSALAPFIYSIF